MKKSLVIALVVCFVLSLAGTALAFPVEFKGDFRLQARSIDDGIAGAVAVGPHDLKSSWWQFRARLGFEGKVDQDTAFFGRISTRNDFGLGNTSTTEFDQYGVKLNAGNWKLSLGRQAVNLGQGTIISTGSDAAGVDNKFDGLVATTKSGNFDLTFIGGKTNTVNTFVVVEYYGLDASTKVDDKLTLGAAFAHAKPNVVGVDPYKIWAVNAAFAPAANFSINAEYAKSNQNTDNKAYFLAGTYSWDKSSFTVQYNNVKNNAVDPFNSGIGAAAYPFMGYGLDLGNTGYKGFTYVYGQQMTKATSFHVIYMDLKVDGRSGSDKELAAGVNWKF